MLPDTGSRQAGFIMVSGRKKSGRETENHPLSPTCLLYEELFFYRPFHRPHTDKCISFDLTEMFLLRRENA